MGLTKNRKIVKRQELHAFVLLSYLVWWIRENQKSNHPRCGGGFLLPMIIPL
jgi:hypothetical protein